MIIGILICLLLSAFFSGVEIAFVSANKLRMELSNKKGGMKSKVLSFFMNSPAEFINTILIGNNLVMVIYGTLMAALVEEKLLREYLQFHNDFAIMLIQTISSTIIVLIFGEYLPKSAFSKSPNKLLEFFSVPVYLFYIIFYIPVKFTKGISSFILKYLFRTTLKEEERVYGKIDLDYLMSESLNQEEGSDVVNVDYFKKALYLDEIKIKECMIPRTEIKGVELHESIQVAKALLVETELSRLIVYNENPDQIVGFIHFFDLFKNPKTIQEILIPIPVLHENLKADEAMEALTKKNKNMALVLDEFGGTAGIVTLEDILEEIFGEIDDEYDVTDLAETVINENEFVFSARLEIDYLNKKYDLNLPEGEYETLSGLIMFRTGRIATTKEKVKIEHFEFEIIKSNHNIVDLVKLKVFR